MIYLIVSLIVVLLMVCSTALGFHYAFRDGFRSGVQHTQQAMMRSLKYHETEQPGIYHELLGQYRSDMDIVVVNMSLARPYGLSTYLYTVLHEHIHATKHNSLPEKPSREDELRLEKEANDYAIPLTILLCEYLVSIGKMKPEDIAIPVTTDKGTVTMPGKTTNVMPNSGDEHERLTEEIRK